MPTPEIKILHTVYDDAVIAVALVSSSASPASRSLALRWLRPRPNTGKDGQLVQLTNHMGGETDWFVVPFSLAAAMGRMLVEQQAGGLAGFDRDGFAALVRWLIEAEELHDAMCY